MTPSRAGQTRFTIRLEAERLLRKLHYLAAAAIRDHRVNAVVSYSAYYSVWVHENLAVAHLNGQAKFLEQPARMFAGLIGQRAREIMWRRGTFAQALLGAAELLLDLSQLVVPVDTGYLRATGNARLERF